MEKIRLYTIDGCPYCAQLKELYIKDNIDFIEVNVNLPENEEEFNKLHKISGSDEVPMVKVGKHLLIPNTSFKSIEEAHQLTKDLLV